MMLTDLIWALMGLLIAGPAIKPFLASLLLLWRGKLAQAKSVDITKYENDSFLEMNYLIRIEFEDESGQTVQTELRRRLNMQANNKEAPVYLLYLPGNPARVKLFNFYDLLLWPLFFISLGYPFLLLGIGHVVFKTFVLHQ